MVATLKSQEQEPGVQCNRKGTSLLECGCLVQGGHSGMIWVLRDSSWVREPCGDSPLAIWQGHAGHALQHR